MFDDFIANVRALYQTDSFIPLHAPVFFDKEKEYLLDVIDSTFVSSVGEYVNRFENGISEYVDAEYSIAVVNGTSALHVSLLAAGVANNDEVITQSLSFVATVNAISYCGAKPVFLDVDTATLGMSYHALKEFLSDKVEIRDDGYSYNIRTNRRIRCCVVMHTFGMPVDLYEIKELCKNYNLILIEDAAEALGSTYQSTHVGVSGDMGVFSFNGNKIITTGGGGVVVTNNEYYSSKIRHLSTTAKLDGPVIRHDEIGYNYRMPNINAALGLAQLGRLDNILIDKKEIHSNYLAWAEENGYQVFTDCGNRSSNFWLNSFIFNTKDERDLFVEHTNRNNVMTRPVWAPLHTLPMYLDAEKDDLINTINLSNRIANIPSGPRKHLYEN